MIVVNFDDTKWKSKSKPLFVIIRVRKRRPFRSRIGSQLPNDLQIGSDDESQRG